MLQYFLQKKAIFGPLFTFKNANGSKILFVVFDSIDRRGESDRKVPRQARPVISRKDVEKVKSYPFYLCQLLYNTLYQSGSGRNGTVAPVVTHPIVTAIMESSEFRTRAQTAPVNSLKRRKDRERAIANVIDNNNDGE